MWILGLSVGGSKTLVDHFYDDDDFSNLVLDCNQQRGGCKLPSNLFNHLQTHDDDIMQMLTFHTFANT